MNIIDNTPPAIIMPPTVTFYIYGHSLFLFSVSKAASLNTAIFGSVCLASRLPSSWHAFVTVIMAVEIFALFPLFREQVKVRAFRKQQNLRENNSQPLCSQLVQILMVVCARLIFHRGCTKYVIFLDHNIFYNVFSRLWDSFKKRPFP